MIHQLARVPDGSVRLMVQGIERIRLLDWVGDRAVSGGAGRGRAGAGRRQATEVDALRRAVVDIFRRLVEASPRAARRAGGRRGEPRPIPATWSYFVASVVPLDAAARQELLELDPVAAKLRRLVDLLQRELAVRELGRKITTDTEERLSKKQREFYLREQLRSIQRELGRGGGRRQRGRPSSAGGSRRPACPRRRGARRSASWPGWPASRRPRPSTA